MKRGRRCHTSQLAENGSSENGAPAPPLNRANTTDGSCGSTLVPIPQLRVLEQAFFHGSPNEGPFLLSQKKHTLPGVHREGHWEEGLMLHLSVFMLVSVYLRSLPLSHPAQMSLDLLYPDAGGAWHLGSESWHYHFLTVPPWASDSSSVRREQQTSPLLSHVLTTGCGPKLKVSNRCQLLPLLIFSVHL